MVQVFVPRVGLTGLISTLQKWGMVIADIVVGSPSVGPAGAFDVSDGAGGWKQSNLTENAAGTQLTGSYLTWLLDSAATGTIALGRIGVLAQQPSFIRNNAQSTYRIDIANSQAFLMTSAAATSLGAGRLLIWDGSQNVYSRPPAAMYVTLDQGGAAVNISANQMHDFVRTFCAIGVGQTFNLPDNASCQQGSTCVIADVLGTAGGSPITIAAAGTDTIQGAPSIQIATNFGSRRIQKRFASTDWIVV